MQYFPLYELIDLPSFEWFEIGGSFTVACYNYDEVWSSDGGNEAHIIDWCNDDEETLPLL